MGQFDRGAVVAEREDRVYGVNEEGGGRIKE